MKKRVDCRAGIYLARLCISELSFAPTQRGAVCAMFFEPQPVRGGARIPHPKKN
jgi:hypothetical protein